MRVMHHLPSCMHLRGINNSSMHLSPRCRNMAGLETFLEKLQYSSDWRNTRHDQETELPEWAHFAKEHNVILRLVEFYPEALRSAVLCYGNNTVQTLAFTGREVAGQRLGKEGWKRLAVETKFVKLINSNTAKGFFNYVLNPQILKMKLVRKLFNGVNMTPLPSSPS